jgi:hypothetical protein
LVDATEPIYRPTAQMIQVKDDLVSKINVELELWYKIRDKGLPKFNELIRNEKINLIGVKEE